jgi:tetratricopeptide (TPR) repeat protein
MPAVYPQAQDDYAALFNNKEYDKSYTVIITKLNEIYSKRVEDRKIPSGYIALSNVGEDTDLLTLFRQRKEKGFFIEDNPELSELHFFAGRSASQLDKKKESLNHYIQALRFRKLEQARDDVIYYEISAIFKKYNEPVYFKGYVDALEQAYTLNPSNPLYSYEIGDALSVTKEKKKSIFHLKRYLDSTDGEVNPEVYLKLGGLYESIGRYLDTEKYYNEYLRRKPDDAEILFALGYISYSKTGNYILAESSLRQALKILKDSDLYRRSKSYEYLGDMSYNNLKYDKALLFYNECISYQSKILELIANKNNARKQLTFEINKLKEALINNKEFEKYEDYEILIDDRNKIDKELEILQLEFNKLQPGRIRWFMAVSYEKTEKYNEAIEYYRESVRYNYNSNKAREMIVKLQLKIKRGY